MYQCWAGLGYVLFLPSAVPYPAVARDPVLQCVRMVTCSLLTPDRMCCAPKFPIFLLSLTSRSSIASIQPITLQQGERKGRGVAVLFSEFRDSGVGERGGY